MEKIKLSKDLVQKMKEIVFSQFKELSKEEREREWLWIGLIEKDFESFYVVFLKGLNPEKRAIRERDLLFPLVSFSCPYFVLFHNHPNGNLEFSKEDIDLTKKTRERMEKYGFKLLEHFIFNKNGYFENLSGR